MTKASLFLMVVFVANVLEQCVGFNYYWQTYPDTQDVVNYPLLSPIPGIWPQDCDKSKESKEESSNESSSSESESGSKASEEASESESSSSSSSSESVSAESKESKEKSGSSEESQSSSEEDESISKEEKEGGKKEKKEESEKGSEEKREAPKKKRSKESESLFPPRTYTFPARPLQQVVYSVPSSYAYMPYRTSYVLQPPVASYPVKTSSNYQYLSLPNSATVLSSYSAPVASQVIKNPVAKIVYSQPAVNYPAVPKTVITPGARVYSVPATWGSSVSYVKK